MLGGGVFIKNNINPGVSTPGGYGLGGAPAKTTFTNSYVTENAAASGGGIYSLKGNLELKGTDVHSNTATTGTDFFFAGGTSVRPGSMRPLGTTARARANARTDVHREG